jgi:hypothetical protein
MNNNRNKIIFVTILLVLLFLARIYKQQQHTTTHTDKPTNTVVEPPHEPQPAEPPHSAGGEHQSVIDPDATLKYTRHARCRMDCRHISEADIKEVLREGHVNEAKSQQNESPCPTYAIEDDRNIDGVRLRIVFAKCEHETKVVTCIDRDHEFECDCK